MAILYRNSAEAAHELLTDRHETAGCRVREALAWRSAGANAAAAVPVFAVERQAIPIPENRHDECESDRDTHPARFEAHAAGAATNCHQSAWMQIPLSSPWTRSTW